ncbi:C40 family peptidase [Streptomyces sp. NPDC026673]|uniref:C40 family peptidase n=1 Tax=Streptomyces sp. NPDC026673 TaxID=3155724 RepID=UPI0033FC1AA5
MKRTAGLACAVLLLLAAPVPAAHADPPSPRRTLQDVRAEVDALYRQAERATGTYNAAHERVLAQQKEIVALARVIDREQARLRTLTAQAGALARAQYRGGGIGPGVGLLLGDDPDAFLDGLVLADRGAQAANATIDELRTTTAELGAYAHSATVAWERLMADQKKAADAKREITTRLARARTLLAGLEARERARLERLEDEAAYRSQVAWLRTDAAARLRRNAAGATRQGAAAVAFATAQIGKPYRWGAGGPAAYDCSALTQAAWRAAGVGIPRTSQEQWRLLPRVPVASMRPGDLVVYFEDAGHVGIYVGDGAIVHAPRPGRRITMAGAGSMPILGVVRPG